MGRLPRSPAESPRHLRHAKQELWDLGLLADQQARNGRRALALSLLDEALAAVQCTGERCWESMLYWRKGELLRHDDAPAEARAAFERAREVAAYQRARGIEQRASASLSRLTLS